jgi:hypothetical protein
VAKCREPSVRAERGGGVSAEEKWERRREVPAERKRELWRPGCVRQERRWERCTGGRWETVPEEAARPFVARQMEWA